ncbi:MAG TPA: hypothetical protein VFV33_22540 [Gemmatimonadaceae bacterium]|nr:hypothetical protein [Gemmatimonadaceae bacterium]
MPEDMMPLTMNAPVADVQGGDAAGREVQNAVRDAVREAVRGAREGAQGAREAAQGATAPAASAPRASQATIDALNAQMAAERVAIEQLTQQLVPGLSDAKETAITSQLEAAQERLSSLQAQLDQALGVTAAQPAAVIAPQIPPEMIPPAAENITYAFFTTVAIVAIGVPLVRAFARWLDRRGAAPSAAIPSDLAQRLDRLEQGVDAIAIEVERVSEGQRFANKLMGEMRALPAPNALEQWPQGAPKEGVPVERRAGA